MCCPVQEKGLIRIWMAIKDPPMDGCSCIPEEKRRAFPIGLITFPGHLHRSAGVSSSIPGTLVTDENGRHTKNKRKISHGLRRFGVAMERDYGEDKKRNRATHGLEKPIFGWLRRQMPSSFDTQPNNLTDLPAQTRYRRVVPGASEDGRTRGHG